MATVMAESYFERMSLLLGGQLFLSQKTVGEGRSAQVEECFHRMTGAHQTGRSAQSVAETGLRNDTSVRWVTKLESHGLRIQLQPRVSLAALLSRSFVSQ